VKTRAELITRALRRLRIVAFDEAATAEQEAVCSEALDALQEELLWSHGINIGDVDLTEDEHFLPLAYLLAVEVAPEFSTAAPETRAKAIVRLGSVINPDDSDVTPEYF
jgi:hypothetical protein